MDGCEPPCGCWELNSGPLEEQSDTESTPCHTEAHSCACGNLIP
ncbi:hypothetical protein T4D_8955 [Trichinella pseudospiralis]|uniref:Uncharacterized protein n=1 Tax=Trichinella pseudospiralis TaxID=6337 RepID=A0A0V1DVB2_TRIPS|nr:hypothetical protein T4D_8955 [Trichinella pseudospiralis]